MARTDFTQEIDSIVYALSNLDRMLDKVSPKLTELSRSSQLGLGRVNTLLSPKNLNWSAEELQTNLNRVMQIKKELSTTVGIDRFLKPETLKTINSELNVILSTIAEMRNSLQMLSTINTRASKIGLTGGVYPFTEDTLRRNYPKGLDPVKTTLASTWGVYNSGTKSLGIAGSTGSLGPLETAIHELGHHIQNLASEAGVNTTGIIQSSANQGENIQPLLEERFKSAGWSSGLARDVATQQTKIMMQSVEEAFAIEFSNLTLSGKTAFPRFKEAIDKVVASLSDDTRKEISALIADLINKYTEQLSKDMAQGVPGTKVREAPLVARFPGDDFIPPKAEIKGRGVSKEIKVFAQESPASVEELGKAVSEAEKKIESLRAELQKLIQESIRGKGTATSEGLGGVYNKLLGGEELSKRQRVGGGQYLTMDKEKRDRLVKLANSINEEIKNLNQIQDAIANVSKTAESAKVGTGAVDAAKQAAAKLQDDWGGAKENPADRKAAWDAQVAVKFGQRFGFNKEQITQVTQAISPLIDLYGRLNRQVKDLAVSYDILADGTIKFTIAAKDQEGITSPKANAYLTKGGQVVSQMPEAPKEVPSIQQTLQKGFPQLNESQLRFVQDYTRAYLELFQQMSKVENKDRTLDVTDTKYKTLADGVTRYTVTLKELSGELHEVNTYMTEHGQMLSESQYMGTKKIGVEKTLAGAFPGLSPEQINQMKASVQPYLDIMNKLGTTLEKVTANYSVLDDGTIRFTVAVEDSAGAVGRANTYLDNQGKILTELAQKQKLSAERAKEQEVSMEQLAAALQRVAKTAMPGVGEKRAEAAMAMAAKSGFGPENLKQVYTQEPVGVSFLKFSKEVDGVIQKLEITVDRFGHVLTRTNRRLLSFFDAIIKNTGELLRWSVGVGLVYGSYYRLQQMVQTAIDNEAKLADVTVTLGDANRELRDILDDTSRVAIATGESINEVLETYVMAYRAVGGISDEIKKTATANQLLYDSTVLNKLSGLDAASAIDVLSGSLRQLQKPGEDVADAFARGTELLDRWVVVSRKANVDLSTLATAFSITSETAENSGLSIEELNAVIASLSEKIGGLGGRETGNAVRALIGGVYQQQAAETLGQYGIAIKDTEGDMRDFLNISKDIYELYAQGIISEDQLNKIGYVLGGGVRRGQQYVAFLTDLPRIMEIVAEQSDSAGAAQDALGRKMDTVKTSITNLGNSTQRLAFTLGSEGGVLGATTSVVTALTLLNTGLEKTIMLFGKMTIPAALLAVASLYFRGDVGKAKWSSLGQNLGLRMGSLATSIMGNVPGMGAIQGLDISEAGAAATGLKGTPQSRAEMYGTRFGQWAGSRALRYGSAIALGALPAISRAGEGDLSGAGVVMGGAIVGALISGGHPVGAIIGAALAETAINGFRNAKGEFEDYFVPPKPEEPGKTGENVLGKMSPEEYARYITEQNVKAFNEQYNITDTAAQVQAALYNFFKFVPQEYEGRIEPGELKGENIGRLMIEDTIRRYEAEGELSGLTKEMYEAAIKALNAITEAEGYNVEQIEVELSRMGRAQGAVAGTYQTTMKGDTVIKGAYTDLLNEIQSGIREDLRDQSLGREIKPKEYREKLALSATIPASTSKLYTALFYEQENFNKATEKGAEIIQKFSDVLMAASQEDIDSLNTLTTTVYELETGLEELEGMKPLAETDVLGEMLNEEEIRKKLEDVKLELREFYAALEREQLTQAREKIKLPTIVGLEGYKPEDLIKIENLAQQMQSTRLKSYEENVPGWTQAFSEDAVREADASLIYLGEQWGYYYKEGMIDPSTYTEAAQQLEALGEIAKIKIETPGYQFMDITEAQFNAIMPEYNARRAQILAAGGESEETELVTWFKDANNPLLKEKDWKLVQYLLGRILEETEKGVEGLYNLPSGATFYVPSQTLELAYNAGYNAAAGAAGGGLGSMVSPGTTTTKTPEGGWPTSAIHPDFGKKVDTIPEAIQKQTDAVSRFEEGTKFWLKNRGEEREKFTPYSDILRGNYEPPKPTRSEELLQSILEVLRAGFGPQAIKENQAELGPKVQGVLDSLSNTLDIFRLLFPSLKAPGIGAGIGWGTPSVTVPDNLKGILSNTAASEKPVTTNLKLDMTSSVQLLVDGRVLANIVKQYLWEDLIRFDTSTSSTRKGHKYIHLYCSRNRNRGPVACGNSIKMRIESVTDPLLTFIGEKLLEPARVIQAIALFNRKLAERLVASESVARLEAFRSEASRLKVEIERLVEALARGQAYEPISRALAERERRLELVEAEITCLSAPPTVDGWRPWTAAEITARLRQLREDIHRLDSAKTLAALNKIFRSITVKPLGGNWERGWWPRLALWFGGYPMY